MGTIRIALSDICVKAYLPPDLNLEEIIIENGAGYFTLFEMVGGVHYILEVREGKRVNELRLGEIVVARGKDPDGRLFVPSGRLETVSAGTPAVFRGPYGQSARRFRLGDVPFPWMRGGEWPFPL